MRRLAWMVLAACAPSVTPIMSVAPPKEIPKVAPAPERLSSAAESKAEAGCAIPAKVMQFSPNTRFCAGIGTGCFATLRPRTSGEFVVRIPVGGALHLNLTLEIGAARFRGWVSEADVDAAPSTPIVIDDWIMPIAPGSIRIRSAVLGAVDVEVRATDDLEPLAPIKARLICEGITFDPRSEPANQLDVLVGTARRAGTLARVHGRVPLSRRASEPPIAFFTPAHAALVEVLETRGATTLILGRTALVAFAAWVPSSALAPSYGPAGGYGTGYGVGTGHISGHACHHDIPLFARVDYRLVRVGDLMKGVKFDVEVDAGPNPHWVVVDVRAHDVELLNGVTLEIAPEDLASCP